MRTDWTARLTMDLAEGRIAMALAVARPDDLGATTDFVRLLAKAIEDEEDVTAGKKEDKEDIGE